MTGSRILLDPVALSADRMETAQVAELKDWLRRYCASRIDFALADERRSLPPYVLKDFANKGLLGMTVPTIDGGLGLSHISFGLLLEQLGAIDTTLSLFVGLSNILGCRPLMNFAAPDIRSAHLKRLATGQILGAFALTEPAAGSNPQAMTTTAKLQDGAFVVDGVKHWIGNASAASIIFVFARTIDEGGKFCGFSAFAVDRDSPGLTIGPEARTMGMRAMDQSEVRFEAVHVAPDRLLGEIGQGMEIAHDAMMHGRLVIAAAAIGTMKRCVLMAQRYASRRAISTGLLAEHPVTRGKIGDMIHRIDSLTALVHPLLAGLDRGIDPQPAILAACKIAASEFVCDTADDLIQILGGRGYIEPNVAPRIFRDTRILRIFEGPTETLTAFLGSTTIGSAERLRASLISAFGHATAFDRLINELPGLSELVKNHAAALTPVDRRLLLRESVGRLAILAILSCAADMETPLYGWLQRRYAATLSGCADRLATSAISVAQISSISAYYDTDIGQDQLRSGHENHQIDPLICYDWSPT